MEDTAASRQLEAHLWRTMDELPGPLRETLVLAAIEGHDLRAVASLGLPLGTVKSRLHRGRMILGGAGSRARSPKPGDAQALTLCIR
jgi:DNA-directed RNA polymerase specialized sigma24 family protein